MARDLGGGGLNRRCDRNPYAQTKRVLDLAKEQRRGNREAKKPKKLKYVRAPTELDNSPWSTVEKLKAQDRSKKRRARSDAFVVPRHEVANG